MILKDIYKCFILLEIKNDFPTIQEGLEVNEDTISNFIAKKLFTTYKRIP